MIHLISGYHKHILPRYIVSFCFENLNFRDYHGDSLNFMFLQFPNCFQPFPLVFPHVSPGVSTVFSKFPLSLILNFAVRNLNSKRFHSMHRISKLQQSYSFIAVTLQLYIVDNSEFKEQHFTCEVKFSDKFSVLNEKTLQQKKQQTKIHFSHRYKLVKMGNFF